MTQEEYIKDKLQDLGKAVDDQIPVNYGFVLLIFPFGPEGIMQYVANAERADVAQSMREWIAMVDEKQYSTDQPDTGKNGFDHWWHVQCHRTFEKSPTVKEMCYDAYVAGLYHHDARSKA